MSPINPPEPTDLSRSASPRSPDGTVRYGTMSKHLSRWIAALVLLAIVDWALTIHAHLTYHHHPGGPTIMPLGQLLGWVTSIGLVAVIVILLIARHRQRTWRYDEIPPGPIPPPGTPPRR